MKTNPAPAAPPAAGGGRSFLLTLLVLLAVLAALFARSFESGNLVFSSDGPLGANAAAFARLPQAFTGMWLDLNWTGGPVGSAFPCLTYLLLWVLSPLGFAKFYAPLCLLSLGLAVWVCFRQLGFRPVACVLGALAMALNTDPLSYVCWGLGPHALCLAWTFLAVAALVTPATQRTWVKAALAGCATGMALEGFDCGAIMSLYVAAFVAFLAWQTGGPPARRLVTAIGRVTLVAVVAGLVAFQALTMLIGTQVKGVAGMAQDQATKERRWNEATQWSLPKLETLRIVIPGLFGYRMPDSWLTRPETQYWGRVGETPGYPGTRHSGSGVYGGVLVVVVAFWALLQSLLGARSRFSPAARRCIWFWTGALLLSLFLAWGRHGPFYQLVYALPYFSTIRNPVKFIHPFSLALVMLFGYGLDGLARAYLGDPHRPAVSLKARLKTWWAAAPVFDRKWSLGNAIVLVASAVAWALYASSRSDLEAYLLKAVPRAPAAAIAGFSLTEVGWFILFLSVSFLLLTLILSGTFTGHRARWGGICLGCLLTADLVRANAPWVIYESFNDEYTPNALTETLRDHAYEHRVTTLPLPHGQLASQIQFLLEQAYGATNLQAAVQAFYIPTQQLCGQAGYWLQRSFRYFDIQSLDVTQEPRPALDNVAYRTRLGYYGENLTPFFRLWQLTNTRFLLGFGGGFCNALNAQFDPLQRRFRVHSSYSQDWGQSATNGPLAVIEFTGALPRAKLFPRWQVSTNDDVTLATLANPEFDPAKTVLVSSPPQLSPAPAAEGATGTVAFVSYAPKTIQLKAAAPTPAVLLLNDKFDPGWSVTVDGHPAEMLRCNYLMRGVALTAGEHTVVFRYRTSPLPLGVSLLAMALGLGLVGLVVREAGRPRTPAPAKPG